MMKIKRISLSEKKKVRLKTKTKDYCQQRTGRLGQEVTVKNLVKKVNQEELVS